MTVSPPELFISEDTEATGNTTLCSQHHARNAEKPIIGTGIHEATQGNALSEQENNKCELSNLNGIEWPAFDTKATGANIITSSNAA